jgi:hypothetical protein
MLSDADWRQLQDLAYRTAQALAIAGVPTQPVADTQGWVVDEHCQWLEEKDYSRLRDDQRLSRGETGYETFLLTIDGRLYYEERTELLLMNRNRGPERMLRDQSIIPVGPDTIWRLDVSGGGASARKTNENGVEVTRGGWPRMQDGSRLHATWGTGLRIALEQLPQRQYTGGSRGNFYAWEEEQRRRVLANPPSGTSKLSATQIYLIAGLVVLVMVIGTCVSCAIGALVLAGSK